MATKRSGVEKEQSEKERKMRDLYDDSHEYAKTLTITEVAEKFGMHPNTYKGRLLDACVYLQVKPPKFFIGRKLPEKFIDRVWETEKTKMRRIHLAQGLFDWLGVNAGDDILFKLVQDKGGKRLNSVVLKKYDKKSDGKIGLDLRKRKNPRQTKVEKGSTKGTTN
jgi:hypothetical protein